MANRITPENIADFDAINKAIDKTVANLERLTTDLTAGISQVRKQSEETTKAAKDLNLATAAGREENGRAAAQVDELAKAYKKYEANLTENAKDLATVKQAQQQLTALHKLEAKEALAAAGSYDQLSAQLSILKIRHKQLSQEQRETTKEGKELTQNIKALNDQLKTIDKTVGVHARSVGSYKDSIKEAVSELGEMPGATGKAAGGVQALGRQFVKLLGNPIVLFITAIVGGLALLGQAFFRSEKGAQLMAKATGAMEAVMSLLVKASLLAVDALTKFANDPLAGIEKLGKSILDNILNRFLAIPRAANEAGKALAALVKGDLEGAKKALEDAGKQAVAFATGLDPAQQKEFAAGLKEVSKEVERQAALFVKLETAKRNIASANRELTKRAEQLQTIEETNSILADDATKSFAEREQAAERARLALEGRAAKEVQIAKNNLSLINQEIDLRKANGENVASLLDTQLASYSALKQAERAYLTAQLNNNKQVAELKQDRLEKDLDILIDGFDNQKTINEKILADETKTIKARRALLEETRQLADSSFKKQIETIQQFTGVNVDANQLIAESDAVALNQKIRSLGLSEIIEGRLLEIVRERKIAVQDLNDGERALNAEQVARAAQLAKFAKDTAAKIRTSEMERFEDVQELAKSEFDLIKTTEKKKEVFQLEQQKARLQKIIEVQKQFGGELSAVEIQTFENTIKGIDAKIKELNGKKDRKTIWDFFIPKSDPNQAEKIAAIQGVLAQAQTYFSEFVNSIQRAADARVQASDRVLQAAENELNRQITLDAAGEANRRQTAERDFQAAQANQARALAQAAKTRKALALIETAEQVSSLITATAGIFKSFAGTGPAGLPLAIGATALMFGAFAASKIAAAKAAKQEFATGGWGEVGGGTHASGNDTNLGFKTEKGKTAYAQKGELFGVVRHERARKYKADFGAIVDSMNKGNFYETFSQVGKSAAALQFKLDGKTDTRKMENLLERIATKDSGGGDGFAVIAPGVTREKRGNLTRTTTHETSPKTEQDFNFI